MDLAKPLKCSILIVFSSIPVVSTGGLRCHPFLNEVHPYFVPSCAIR